MNSRVASAVSSRQAKQQLVKLLFGNELSRKGPEAHIKLDYSIYTYKDLRKTYLEKLQIFHPDKQKHKQTSSKHEAFVELRDAWDEYEKVAKMLEAAGTADANFTMFGVGCSFSDNPEEMALRAEITDQACRGWFSAGSLPIKSETEAIDSVVQSHSTISLCDDDMFVPVDKTESNRKREDKDANHRSSKPSLVGSFRPRRYR